MPRFLMPAPVDEGTTCFLHLDEVRDENGVAIPGSALDAAVLTLTDKDTGAVINGVSGVDVQSSWSEAGEVNIQLDPADNDIVGSGVNESHVARMEYTYDTNKVGMVEWEFRVRRY